MPSYYLPSMFYQIERFRNLRGRSFARPLCDSGKLDGRGSHLLLPLTLRYDQLRHGDVAYRVSPLPTVRQQVELTKPLYERRHKIVSQIPGFWPLVLEQAPPDIDQYIQPSDSALLLSSLTSLSVSHFEIADGAAPTGDPRSVAIRWEFATNEYFSDSVLEKKFWYRRARDGWTGYVSEPVPIRWKEGKDLTGGLLDLVCNVWAVEHAAATPKPSANTDQHKALKRKIEGTGMGGLSFFAWFGFIGRRVTAAESSEAESRETQRRESRKKGQTSEVDEPEEEEEEEELDMSLEIFPDGDDLAIAITEDLWPGALKFFSKLFLRALPLVRAHTNRLGRAAQAQEQDALSDADFESGDEEDEEQEGGLDADSDGSDEGRPTKRRKE